MPPPPATPAIVVVEVKKTEIAEAPASTVGVCVPTGVTDNVAEFDGVSEPEGV